MKKEKIEIKDKYIKVCLPKIVNFTTFEQNIEKSFSISKELNRIPIILNIENSILNFRIIDVIKLVNNNPAINSTEAKITNFAIVYNGKNQNELVEMLDVSLKNIGFIKVERFTDSNKAIDWIDKD